MLVICYVHDEQRSFEIEINLDFQTIIIADPFVTFRRLKISFISGQDVLFKKKSECAGSVDVSLIEKVFNNILMEGIWIY